MTIAPVPSFPERGDYVYERKMAPNVGGVEGPLRFEEGIQSDTDVPNDFARGQAENTDDGRRPGHNNPETQYKHADETLKERAHLGSASWVEAPTFLGEFAQGAFTGYDRVEYLQVDRGEGRKMRHNPTVVSD
jgi:hypothetical protein